MRDLIEKAIGELTEALRYVRSKPQAAINHASKAMFLIEDIWASRLLGKASRIYALRDNVNIGCRVHACDPEVLSGYLYGAAFELRNLQMTEYPE